MSTVQRTSAVYSKRSRARSLHAILSLMGHLHRLYTRRAAEVWRKESALLAASGLVRPPMAVQWLVTSACDLSCPHCYSGAGRRQRHELTTEEAKRAIIDELAAMVVVDGEGSPSPPTLVLAGGELLLRRDIPELVAYATRRGVPWAMHTHGAHVFKHRDWLARNPPSLAAISLDGEAHAHDAFRGKTGSHASALEAVALLRDIGCGEVVIGTTVTRRNADALADLFPTVRTSGAHSWGLHLFAPEGRGAEHLTLFPTDDQLRRVVAFARRARCLFHVELCNEWGGAGADDLHLRDDPFACGAGRISCVIGAEGHLLPCTTTDLRESEGNVREHGLRELWLRGFSRFRRHGADPCGDDQECWLQSRNGNACRHRAFEGASLQAQDPEAQDPEAQDRRSSPDPLVRLRLSMADDPPGEPSRLRLGGPNALASARAMVLASLIAPGCTPHASTSDPAVSTQESPPEARTSPPGTRTTAALPSELASELSRWPKQLDEAGLIQRYEQTQHAQQLDLPESPETASVEALEQRLHDHEHAGLFHPSVVVHIWAELGRRFADDRPLTDVERAALIRLMARLRRHARVVDTLVHAEAETGPVEFHAWRSKAAPAHTRDRVTLPEGLLEAALQRWPQAGAGSWETEACIEVELHRGRAWRLRGAVRQELVVGDPVAVCRLDLLVVAPEAELADCCLGRLSVQPDVPTSAWELGVALSPTAREALREATARALSGDESALAPLLGQLAQSQSIIRRALQREPSAKGAPALRQLLWSWDR
jgi:AdoMet-dependent heme synthase